MKNHDIINFFMRTQFSGNASILDVGGGNGNLLDNIVKYFPNQGKPKLYNLELCEFYRNYQINKEITFLVGSALSLPFKDQTFDFVVSNALLHHLVGKSRRESTRNAGQAVREFIRVTKPGGYVIINEIYNESRAFAHTLFLLTSLGALFHFHWGRLGWYKDVIVCFLTPSEIDDLMTDLQIIDRKLNRSNVSLRFRLTLLHSNVGYYFLVGRRTL